MSPEALRSELLAQIGALDSIARSHGSRVHHVKPHGALYHQAIADEECAKVVSSVVAELPGRRTGRSCRRAVARRRVDREYAPSPRRSPTAATALTDHSSRGASPAT